METKKEIRSRILKLRRAMTSEERSRKSQIIANRVSGHRFYGSADIIFCYADYNGEVQTGRIVQQAVAEGKAVAMPRVEGTEMEFYLVREEADLEPGCMGIPEPRASCIRAYDYMREQKIEEYQALVLMPGAVFDQNRHRIGYGGGYYDKYLERHPRMHTAALAYDLQIQERIPYEAYDICPEIVITEEQVIEKVSEEQGGNE